MQTLSIPLTALLLVAIPAAALPTDQPVGASTPTTTCTAISGPLSADVARLSGCTRSTTGGRGTLEMATPGRHRTTDIVYWKNGGTTTFTFTNGAAPAAPCPPGYLALGISGRVTASTGAAAAIRGHVAATVCLPGKRSVRLAAGTVWTF